MRVRASALLVAIFLTVTSCENSTAPGDPIIGAWKLRTWDGKSLPAITYGVTDGYSESLVGERFVLSEDGNYTFSRTTRYMPEGRSETRTGVGSWKRTESGYALGMGLVPGTISLGRLTVQWKGDGKTNWVYGSAN